MQLQATIDATAFGAFVSGVCGQVFSCLVSKGLSKLLDRRMLNASLLSFVVAFTSLRFNSLSFHSFIRIRRTTCKCRQKPSCIWLQTALPKGAWRQNCITASLTRLSCKPKLLALFGVCLGHICTKCTDTLMYFATGLTPIMACPGTRNRSILPAALSADFASWSNILLFLFRKQWAGHGNST